MEFVVRCDLFFHDTTTRITVEPSFMPQSRSVGASVLRASAVVFRGSRAEIR